MWRTADMSWMTCAVIKQIQSNPIVFPDDKNVLTRAITCELFDKLFSKIMKM